jgi:hypothetical protein
MRWTQWGGGRPQITLQGTEHRPLRKWGVPGGMCRAERCCGSPQILAIKNGRGSDTPLNFEANGLSDDTIARILVAHGNQQSLHLAIITLDD